jgi:DNA-binding NtrC family response regulator
MKRIILIDDQYQNISPLLEKGLAHAYAGAWPVRFESIPFMSYYRVESLAEYDIQIDKFLSAIPEGERRNCCILLDWVFMYTSGGVNKSEWHGKALFEKLSSAGFNNIIIFSNYTDDEEFQKVLLKNGLCIAKPSQEVMFKFQRDASTVSKDEESIAYFRNLRLLIQSLFFDEQLERYGMLLGSSTEMKEVAELIERAAGSDVNVLILGDTGTGKELTAKAIHNLSGRSKKRFLAINCSGIPSDLLETELFGYAPGTFTDQLREGKLGLLREADGGTILLDEIGDMPLLMQSKLLRFLQDRTVRPVGDISEHEVDVRIICSTNRNLQVLIQENERTRGEKGFRSDLFWRIRVLEIHLLPLVERLEKDQELFHLLFYHHLRRAFRKTKPSRIANLHLSSAAQRLLLAYDWPGNFREFENVVLGATALLGEDEIVISDRLLLRLIRKKESNRPVLLYLDLLLSGGSVKDVPKTLQGEVLESFIRASILKGSRLQSEDLIGVVLGEQPASNDHLRKKQTSRVTQFLYRRGINLRRIRKERNND